MSTTPFARRKLKKEELEELPVIGMRDVPAPDEVPAHGEPTRSGIIVPDDATDLDLRLIGEPEKKLSHETVEHKGEDEALNHLTNQDRVKDLPVIRAVQPKPVEVEPEATVSFTKPTTTDHIKLGPGDTTLWREGVRPAKKADKQ